MPAQQHLVERVPTAVRMEKRVRKVLTAFAEYHDLTLGDPLEGIVLPAFDGKCPFQASSFQPIKDFKKLYAIDLEASASHQLVEAKPGLGRRKEKPGTRISRRLRFRSGVGHPASRC
jgi:hypothetical protein